jgi:hypothetical protein
MEMLEKMKVALKKWAAAAFIPFVVSGSLAVPECFAMIEERCL